MTRIAKAAFIAVGVAEDRLKAATDACIDDPTEAADAERLEAVVTLEAARGVHFTIQHAERRCVLAPNAVNAAAAAKARLDFMRAELVNEFSLEAFDEYKTASRNWADMDNASDKTREYRYGTES